MSNWDSKSAQVLDYERPRGHLHTDVHGQGHMWLPQRGVMDTLARYKFYLAFENSFHPDYITDKLWKNALETLTVLSWGPAGRTMNTSCPLMPLSMWMTSRSDFW